MKKISAFIVLSQALALAACDPQPEPAQPDPVVVTPDETVDECPRADGEPCL